MNSDQEESKDRGALGRMVFDATLAIVVAAVGYFVSGIAAEIKELKTTDTTLRSEISAIRERQPIDYVRKEEYRSDIVDIKRLLERIEGKVDRKQDRATESAPGSWRSGKDINR